MYKTYKTYNLNRIKSPIFWNKENDGILPTSATDLIVEEIDRYRARDLNSLWHSRLPIYNTGFCLNSLISFGAFYLNVYYAIAIWTNPVAANLPQKEWLELRRLAISDDAPKYIASYMIGKMVKEIKIKFPYIKTLVSYQDTSVHKGVIYKASNWKKDGIHKGGSWNRPNSRNKNGKRRTRPDLNNAVGEKQRWVYNL